jgi:hypothetical protein
VIAATAKSARQPADCDDSLADELFRSVIWAIRSRLAIWLLDRALLAKCRRNLFHRLDDFARTASILGITSPACAAIGTPK